MPTPTAIIDVVGGPSVVGSLIVNQFDLIRAVRAGLPVNAVHALMQSGRLSRAETDRVVLPRKTLAHRERIGTPDRGSIRPSDAGRPCPGCRRGSLWHPGQGASLATAAHQRAGE